MSYKLQKLGLIDEKHLESHNLQHIINLAWSEHLAGSDLTLIDLHTPLWLWSRGGLQDLFE